MSELLTMQDLANGHLDVKALGEAANGDENTIVTTRTGNTYPSAERAINIMFQNGGLPAKPFATLAQMNTEGASLPDGQLAMVYNETANNGLYVKTAGSWTKTSYSPMLQSDVREEIDAFADTFIDKSNNLFDANAATVGKYVASNGTLADNPLFSVSDFTVVSANNTYTISSTAANKPAFATLNFFNNEKTFISRTTVEDTAGAKTFTTPINTAYIRLNIYDGLPSENNRMMNIGESELTYEPYKEVVLKNVTLSDANIAQVIDTIDTDNPYIVLSPNLYNRAANKLGFAISETGDEVINAVQAISEFIPVIAGDKYTISSKAGNRAFADIAYYTEAKVFISRSATYDDYGALTLTMPANAAFVRFNVPQNAPTERERMFVAGSVALPYKPYQLPTLTGVKLGADVLEQIGGGGSNGNYIVESNNLFDEKTAKIGVSVLDTGVIGANAAYSLSDFIPVVVGEQYTMSGDYGISVFIHTAFYTLDKVFINRITTATLTAPLTITIPVGAAFVRFNMNKGLPSENNRMFNKGATALPYEKGGSQFTGVRLANDVIAQINSELKLDKKDTVMFSVPVDGVFNTDEVWTQYTSFVSIPSIDVYAMYDALQVQHPTYITKQALGNDAWGNPIAAYKFKPEPVVTTAVTRKVKVFIVCGVHGMEHMSPLAAYLMLEQMCNNWRSDQLLEALRFNVEFIVIPVANPSGWNKYERKNDNGVDLNRNFPEGFGWQSTDPSSAYYGGAAPFDQLETQYIKRVFDENPDIDICYDFHNFGGLSGTHYMWLAVGDNAYVEHMGAILMQRMGRKWQKEFTWLPQEPTWTAGYTNKVGGGMVHDHALARGIKFTATFEVATQHVNAPEIPAFNEIHCKTAMEAITNWVLINLYELSRL